MCGIQGGVAAATTTGIASQVAGTSGGGLVAGATGGGQADIMANLQALAAQVEALSAALGGTSLLGTSIGGGAPAPLPPGMPPQGLPTQGDPTQGDPTQGGHVHGANGKAKKHGKGHDKSRGAGHDKHQIERNAPEREKLAQRNLDAAMSLSDIKRSEVKRRGKTEHYELTPAMIKKFKREHPGLPAPTWIVFGDKGAKPIGVVYRTNENPNLDLGMGSMHAHNKGKPMQHIWFTPDDLELAMSDKETKGINDKVSRIVNGPGAG